MRAQSSQGPGAGENCAVESENHSDLLGSTRFWFLITLLYLILDYSRIYGVFHIGFLRPLMITILILSYFLFAGNKYYLARSYQTTWLWLFVALLFAYVPFAVNNHYAYVVFMAQFLYMPFILSVIVCVRSLERLKKLIFICICLEIYIALYAITHAGYGPGNYFDDENDLALYINMWLPFCYFLFWAEDRFIIRLIYLTGLVVGLFSIVVSFSRGGFVGLLAVCGTVWLFSRRKVLAVVLLFLSAGIIFYYVNDNYWTEMSTITNTESGTSRGRMENWKSAWRMFLDHPLGVGGGNFSVRFSEYQTDYFQRVMWGKAAHSLWFTLLAELGIFGVLIFFRLLYLNLKDIFILCNIDYNYSDDGRKYLNYLGKSFIASFAGYFVSGTFLSVLYYAHYWYLTSIIVAASQVARDICESTDSSSKLLP